MSARHVLCGTLCASAYCYRAHAVSAMWQHAAKERCHLSSVSDMRPLVNYVSGLYRPLQQVWTNCRLYNPEGHPVRQMGDRLSDAWEKKWHASQIEAKWEALMREEKEDEVPFFTSHIVFRWCTSLFQSLQSQLESRWSRLFSSRRK